MTDLTKPITRKTKETRFEKSQLRNIVISVEPVGRDGAVVGVRLAGTRQTYRLSVQSIYNLAVQSHIWKIEKIAKRYQKEEKLPMRSARVKARKQAAEDLK